MGSLPSARLGRSDLRLRRCRSNVLQDEKVNARILEAFEKEGADAWFAEGAKERFLAGEHDGDKWQMVTDILDVWFDSGSTHTFTLEDRRT